MFSLKSFHCKQSFSDIVQASEDITTELKNMDIRRKWWRHLWTAPYTKPGPQPWTAGTACGSVGWSFEMRKNMKKKTPLKMVTIQPIKCERIPLVNMTIEMATPPYPKWPEWMRATYSYCNTTKHTKCIAKERTLQRAQVPQFIIIISHFFPRNFQMFVISICAGGSV